MSALLLRAWIEPGAPPRLRARLLELRPGRDPQSLAVTASVEEACQAVRGWLESLPGPADGTPASGTAGSGTAANAETSSENGDGTVTHRG